RLCEVEVELGQMAPRKGNRETHVPWIGVWKRCELLAHFPRRSPVQSLARLPKQVEHLAPCRSAPCASTVLTECVESPLRVIDRLRYRGLHPAHSTLNTFITSSPRWLMTLTAMRPVSGTWKGREVSE